MKRINYSLLSYAPFGMKIIRFFLFSFLLFMGVVSVQAQNRQLGGTVTDTSGEPLIGVSVLLKGTTNGTVTDLNGSYILLVPSGAVISFSYVGYITQELEAGNRTRLDVRLAEDTQALDEVIVVGYGVQKKSSVTGAISQVKSEDMLNRTITRPEQALQGKTAGVQVVQSSAAPGASPDIRIRGLSSNYSSTPLFVVDGRIASTLVGLILTTLKVWKC